MDRIDHGTALPGGAYTTGAEEFFNRMRRLMQPTAWFYVAAVRGKTAASPL